MRTHAAITGVVIAILLAGCKPSDPTVRETPIKIVSETEGIGPAATYGNTVRIRYALLRPDGSKLLEADNYRFKLGTHSVISGVEDAVTGMKRRGERVVQLPPQKHWGRKGYGNGAVPPDTWLTLHVEVLSVD